MEWDGIEYQDGVENFWGFLGCVIPGEIEVVRGAKFISRGWELSGLGEKMRKDSVMGK